MEIAIGSLGPKTWRPLARQIASQSQSVACFRRGDAGVGRLLLVLAGNLDFLAQHVAHVQPAHGDVDDDRQRIAEQ